MKGIQDRSSERNLEEERNRSRGHGGTLHIGLLLTVCPAYFLIPPKMTSTGWHHPQRAVLPKPSTDQENTPHISSGHSDGVIFSTKVPSSQLTLLCIELKTMKERKKETKKERKEWRKEER